MDKTINKLCKLANLPETNVLDYLIKINEFTKLNIQAIDVVTTPTLTEIGHNNIVHAFHELRYEQLFANGQHNQEYFISKRTVREH